MRSLRFIATASAALLAFAPSAGHAESRWSSAAGAGLAFTSEGTGSGFWADIFREAAPNWSVGVEAGYVLLADPGQQWVTIAASPASPLGLGYVTAVGDDNRLASLSVALRGRSPGPTRVHFLGTLGYYDLSTRPDPLGWNGPGTAPPRHVYHEQYPGFSLGLGVSAAGMVRPAIQLRWHQVILPHHEYVDVVTFEAGLHFN